MGINAHLIDADMLLGNMASVVVVSYPTMVFSFVKSRK
jgi:hypothetical protein